MFIPKEHGMPCTKLLARLSNEGLTILVTHPYTLFYIYKQHFYKQRQLKLAKNQANAKQHPEAEFLPFENCPHFSST